MLLLIERWKARSFNGLTRILGIPNVYPDAYSPNVLTEPPQGADIVNHALKYLSFHSWGCSRRNIEEYGQPRLWQTRTICAFSFISNVSSIRFLSLVKYSPVKSRIAMWLFFTEMIYLWNYAKVVSEQGSQKYIKIKVLQCWANNQTILP